MLNLKTLNSLKNSLIVKGSILVLILILYLVFIYVIQRYDQNISNGLSASYIIQVANILFIVLLSLILLVTGSFVFTMSKIFKYKSNLDSSLSVQTETSLDQNEKPFDKTEAEKIKNERLYTMGNLAAGIIHDFKNPISTISLSVQAIMAGYAEREKRDFYLRKIEDQVDRMLNMTQDFLDYAQGQKSVRMQEVEFTKTIKNQIEFHRDRATKKNIGLYYTLPDPFYIRIDVHKFRRVLDNIMINAMEVLKPGQFLKIDMSTDRSIFRMQISDNGPGIPPDILPEIFEPFFTHGKSKGSGLGLSISKKIVEDHGGSLTVDSEEGKGTSFMITLPPHLFCNASKSTSVNIDVIPN